MDRNTRKDWRIESAPDRVENVVATHCVRRHDRGPLWLVRTSKGEIFCLYNWRINLADSWDGLNAHSRRAICDFAGWDAKELTAYVAKKKRDDAKAESDKRLASLRMTAGKLGYKLVKHRAKERTP
jgi:hypothetical protein